MLGCCCVVAKVFLMSGFHTFKNHKSYNFPQQADNFVVSYHIHGTNHAGQFMHQSAPDSDLCICKHC